MGTQVALSTDIHPNLLATHLHWEDLNIICKRVKRPACAEIKACRMPVAGKNAIAAGAAIQGKAHVGAAVIQRVHVPSRVPEDEGTPSDMHCLAPPCVQVVDGCHSLPIGTS
ncbi:hypothetical protein KDH_26750 [Dictyobacter sp. S3.2.2.5]|uniref:Uncharacterized protein n=1 Tax=Dictyobacter halimunensis TaxID=3026934 RepID=A0ABQ6FNJ9_9CHLR|nr:hypothetical protein KDH_26750 [Dictyobacter sp. S3.2.2.5]